MHALKQYHSLRRYRFDLLIPILLVLLNTNLVAQKTLLLPPVLELNVPDENWIIKTAGTGKALWSNDEKVIENLGGQAEIKVFCFHENNIPQKFDPEGLKSLLKASQDKDSKDWQVINGFHTKPITKNFGEWLARAWNHTEDGYWTIINFSYMGDSEKVGTDYWNRILSFSKILKIQEMDQRFGYPLDQKADNSAYIEKKREELVRYRCPTGTCKETRAKVNKIPLEELVPEMYNGFSFERLFLIMGEVQEGTIPLNDYYNSIFLEQDSPDIKLYKKYLDRHDGSFDEKTDIAVLRKNMKATFDKEAFLVDQSYAVSTYRACNGLGEKTHIWRLYLNKSNDKMVAICFHKDGKPLKDPSDWKVTEAHCPIMGADPEGGVGFYLSAPEEESERRALTDDEVKEFEKAMSVGTDKQHKQETSDVSQDPFTCNNRLINIFGLSDYNKSESRIYFGIATNANTHFIVVDDFPDKYDIRYEISDSVSYDIVLSGKLIKEFEHLGSDKKEKLLKQIDPLYLESRGDDNVNSNPAFYAGNSRLFSLPRDKRLYSSGFLYEDLNGDGKQDLYRFMISNGELVNGLVLYEKDGEVILDTTNDKYKQRFLNSELGKLMIRISLQEKNLLYMKYWNFPEGKD